MRRVRDKDFLSRNSLGVVIGPHHQQAGEFSLGAGRGLQGDRIHAGNFEEAVTQGFDDS